MKSETWKVLRGAVLLDLVQAITTAALSLLPTWWSLRRPGPATLDLLGSHLTLQHWALVFLYLQTPWFVRYARFWWMSYGDLYLLGNAQHISKSGVYVWQLVFQRIIGCFVCTNINQRFKAIKFHIHVLLENNSLDFCFNHLPHQKKLEVPFSSVNMYSNQDV